jgi:hypothetical protein
MTCHSSMEKIYAFMGEKPLPLRNRLQIAVHVILCPRCAGEIARLEAVREIMRTDFLPPSPALVDSIMKRIRAEVFETADMPFEVPAPSRVVPFGGWVITGFVVLLSLTSTFMGMDFVNLAPNERSSFLLPVGITIGVAVTGYGANFIGSHLKELSDRFRLR